MAWVSRSVGRATLRPGARDSGGFAVRPATVTTSEPTETNTAWWNRPDRIRLPRRRTVASVDPGAQFAAGSTRIGQTAA